MRNQWSMSHLRTFSSMVEFGFMMIHDSEHWKHGFEMISTSAEQQKDSLPFHEGLGVS